MTLYEVLHEVHALKIRFHHCNDEVIFVRFLKHRKVQSPFYLGDLVTYTGERKISAVFRRLLNNLEELAYMTKDDTSEGGTA